MWCSSVGGGSVSVWLNGGGALCALVACLLCVVFWMRGARESTYVVRDHTLKSIAHGGFGLFFGALCFWLRSGRKCGFSINEDLLLYSESHTNMRGGGVRGRNVSAMRARVFCNRMQIVVVAVVTAVDTHTQKDDGAHKNGTKTQY